MFIEINPFLKWYGEMQMKTSIKAALITGILGAVATVAAAFIGSNVGEKNAVQQLYSQITTINGNNNTITVNSVDDFITQYNKLLNENETLKAQNSQYFADYTEQKNINNSLEVQLSDNPVVSYNDVGLCVEGNDMPINKQKSMITIDGREYYSKELAEKFLDKNQSLTIKDNTIFIGKVIADKADLTDQRVMDISGDFVNGEKATDSYGNPHFNSITCGYYDGTIIYNLNRQYNYLRCSFSINEDGSTEGYTSIRIEADDEQVYSETITKLQDPIIGVEIPINNCSLLKISCEHEDASCSCIISDAIVYN